MPMVRRRDWLGMVMAASAFASVALLRIGLVPTLLVLAPIAVALHWRRR
jgi:chromate transporter